MADIIYAKNLIKDCKEKKRDYLDLGNCGITNLNDLPELFDCSHLETLILSNQWWDVESGTFEKSINNGNANDITFIPSQIAHLTSLTTLIASGDLDINGKILDVSHVYQLRSLKYLSLANNIISDISNISSLLNLEYLDLSSNLITDIPSLNRLNQLKVLDLASNLIYDLESLKELRNLEVLNLSKNHIED